jgi:hypothetical protein
MITDYVVPPTASELYERSDFTRFNEVHDERFGTYLDFLHRNDLTTVFDEGQNADAFDQSIRRGRRSGPVRSRSVSSVLARSVLAPSAFRRSILERLGRK